MNRYIHCSEMYVKQVFSAGRRLRVATVAQLSAHRAIPQSLSCPLLFDGPKLWVIACYWFDSDARLNMPA